MKAFQQKQQKPPGLRHHKQIQTNTNKCSYSNTNISGTVDTDTDVVAYSSGEVGYTNVQSRSNVNASASTYSSKSSTSQTSEYDGAAAYAAARQERAKWNDEYLKNNTIYLNETKRGLLNVKFKKGSLVRLKINIENLDYVFDWDPEDSEN